MRRIFFDHIPKTGGTAVTSAILRAAAIDPNTIPDLRTLGTVRYGDLLADYDTLPLISAHCSYESRMPFATDRVHCVLLRDPVERFLSIYAFNREDVPADNNLNAFVRKAKTLDAGSFLLGADADQPGEAFNWYLSHFLPLGWDGEEFGSEAEKLPVALRGLERFDVVGLQDAMEEFCDTLCGAAGIEGLPKVEVVNPTSRPLRREDLDPAVLRELEGRLELDCLLYEHARQLVRRRRGRMTMSGVKPEAAPTQAAAPSEPPIGASLLVPVESREEVLAFIQSVDIVGDVSEKENLLTEDLATLRIDVVANRALEDLALSVAMKNSAGKLMFGTSTRTLGHAIDLQPGTASFLVRFQNRLGLGDYTIEVGLHFGMTMNDGALDYLPRATFFRVLGTIGDPFEGQVRLHPEVRAYGGAGTLRALRAGGEDAVFLANRGMPLTDFGAELRCTGRVPALRIGDICALKVTVTNLSDELWQSTGLRRVTLSYQWRVPESGEVVVLDGLRSEIGSDLAPGESREMWMKVAAPEQRGRFELWLSPVQEGVAWFLNRGFDPLRLTAEIVE